MRGWKGEGVKGRREVKRRRELERIKEEGWKRGRVEGGEAEGRSG